MKSRIINFLKKKLKGILLRFIIIRICLIIINYILTYIWGDNLTIGILLSSNEILGVTVGVLVTFGCIGLVGKGIYKAYHYFFDKPEPYVFANVIKANFVENAAVAAVAAEKTELAVNVVENTALNGAKAAQVAVDSNFDDLVLSIATRVNATSANNLVLSAKFATECADKAANFADKARLSIKTAFSEKTCLATEMAIKDSILNAKAAEDLVAASKVTYLAAKNADNIALDTVNASMKGGICDGFTSIYTSKLAAEMTVATAATALNSAALTATLAHKAVAVNTSGFAVAHWRIAKETLLPELAAKSAAASMTNAALAIQASERAAKNSIEAANALNSGPTVTASSEAIWNKMVAAEASDSAARYATRATTAQADAFLRSVEVHTARGGGVWGSICNIGSAIKDIFF